MEEDDDDFTRHVQVESEEEELVSGGGESNAVDPDVEGMASSSPMLDDSIMSHNATMKIEGTPSRYSVYLLYRFKRTNTDAEGAGSSWAFKSVFGLNGPPKAATSTIKKAVASSSSSPVQSSLRPHALVPEGRIHY